MTNNISFKSTFRPVKSLEYNNIASRIDKKFFVDFPWTVKESVKASQAKTGSVFDCSVLGITDGKDVLMLHLCPTMKENLDFNKIKNFILKKIKLGNPDLQAALIGSQHNQSDSKSLFDFLYSLMEKWNIPCSKLCSSDEALNIAYQSKTDEWIISSPQIDRILSNGEQDSREIIEKSFKVASLSSVDEYA